MSARCRVAVAGCGFFAPNHLHAWAGLPEAEVVAVCDLDGDRAAAASELAGGAPAFTDAREMLEEVRPDVVDIVTTAPAHLPLAQLCAEMATAAIIQKPLAFSLEDAVRIADLSRAADVPMMVHENFRFQQPVRKIRDLVASGEIGEPRYCRIAFRCGYDVFAGQPYLREDERLVLADIGVHVLDVARFLMGEIDGLSCRTQHVRADVRGEDMATALVGFEGGGMGMVGASWSSFLPDDPFPETLIAVEGRDGAIVLDRHYRIEVRSADEQRSIDAEPPCPAWGERPWHVVQDSVARTCAHWLDAWAGRTPLETSVEDNLNTLAAVEACYRSAAQGGAVVRPAAMLAEAGRGAC